MSDNTDTDMVPQLNQALASALRDAIVDVQPTPVIIACRWCGKRSNPRRDVDTALDDLDGHLGDHPEFADALLAAWNGTREELADALEAYALTERP